MLGKILDSDLVDKGVIGLPDIPGLPVEEMQRKFEETAREVIIPKFNALVDELSAEDAAGKVGAVGVNPQALTEEQKVAARENIAALTWEADALDDAQKRQARANIGAIGAAEIGEMGGTVSYEAQQNLSEGQQAQARENIGAAPSGYGLGEEQATKWVDDCDLAVESGLYRVSAGAANSPIASGTVLKVEAFTPTTKRQTVMANAATASFVTRFMTGGVWGEWEWTNPPMTADIEYRTTERWAGSPVYKKRISYTPNGTIGSTTDYADVEIPHGIENWQMSVGVAGTIDGSSLIPYGTTGGGYIMVNNFNGNSILLRLYKATWGKSTLRFDLSYVKKS